MNGISQSDRDALPSTRSLLKATGIAIAVAAVVLVSAVLPAEYGIDPTGIGGRLGLKSLSAGGAAITPAPVVPVAAPAAEASGPAPSPKAVWRSPIPYRSDEMSLELLPGKGAEIKAAMQKGDRFVFSWTVDGGAADYDMHGEKPAAKEDEFTSYLKGSARKSGHGAFEAPFDGTHGWYWKNGGKQPVTVRVRTSGYYEKLYRP